MASQAVCATISRWLGCADENWALPILLGVLVGASLCYIVSHLLIFSPFQKVASWLLARLKHKAPSPTQKAHMPDVFATKIFSPIVNGKHRNDEDVGLKDTLLSPAPTESTLSSTSSLKPDPYNPAKREGYLSWDDYFMAIAFLSAHRSKDPNRQVGACLVSQDRVILGIGYNGFPRGCSDDMLPWAKMSADGDCLKTKYPYVCHAEVNAILNKNHASACGQRLYVTMFPCNECAKIIIQAGVAEVVYFIDKGPSSDYCYIASRRLLSLARVKVWQHQPSQRKIVVEFK